jgi:hypothetical protein
MAKIIFETPYNLTQSLGVNKNKVCIEIVEDGPNNYILIDVNKTQVYIDMNEFIDALEFFKVSRRA